MLRFAISRQKLGQLVPAVALRRQLDATIRSQSWHKIGQTRVACNFWAIKTTLCNYDLTTVSKTVDT